MSDKGDDENTAGTNDPPKFHKLAALIGIVPSLALFLSIVHEWTYFFVIDADLIRLMRIGDYFSSLLKWVPGTTIAMFLGIVALYVTKRVENFKSEDELIASSPFPRFTKFLRWSERYFVRGMVFIGVPLAVLKMPAMFLPFIGAPLTVGWVYLAGWLINHDRVLGGAGRRYKAVIEGIPALAIMIGMFGAFDATTTLLKPSGDRQIVLQDGLTINAVLLRPLELGVIVRQPELEKIIVYTWDEVREIRQISETPSSLPTGCSLLGIFCKD